jgi:hypothetical protein
MTTDSPVPGRARERTVSRLLQVGPLTALAVVVAALVAACGGSASSPHGASSNLTNQIQHAESSSERQTGVLFDTCMRTHGIPNFPDSAIKIISGQVVFDIPASVKSNPHTAAALQTCEKDLPHTSNSPSGSSANFQYGLRYAKCMRAHGINYPDPGSQQGASAPAGNPNAPAFKTASKACQAQALRSLNQHSNRS